MRKYLIGLIIIAFSGRVLLAQTIEFSADFKRIEQHIAESRTDTIPSYISDQQWFINGQVLKYGSDPISYSVKKSDSKSKVLHQLEYRGPHKKNTTIYFKPTASGSFEFFYNECCGAFYLHDKTTNKRATLQIQVELQNEDPKALYLIQIGTTGMIYDAKTSSKDVIQSECRSAMAPDVYQISIVEITPTNDTDEEAKGVCLIQQGKEEVLDNYAYNVIKELTSFQFLSLKAKGEFYIMVYDVQKGAMVSVQ